MLNQILAIINIVVNSFLHVWLYLLLTIPLAVVVQISGAARYINRALKSRPVTAILLAGIVGAFSPFCSCGVIPVIAALLMGGVPLAPVITFWIASLSMAPEIFFLSVATIGWQLAVWRLAGTLVLSLTAGLITQFIMQRGWLGQQILRSQRVPSIQSWWELLTKKVVNKIEWRKLRRCDGTCCINNYRGQFLDHPLIRPYTDICRHMDGSDWLANGIYYRSCNSDLSNQ